MYFFISPHSQLLLDMVFKSIWEMLFHKLHNMWKSKFHTPTYQTTTNEWVVIYNENPNELPKLVVHTLEKTTSL
jgi:CTP:phosphocholine cytidylyltransferase-like protein